MARQRSKKNRGKKKPRFLGTTRIPPKTKRYCMLCERMRKFIYNPTMGHSECNYCGGRVARKEKLKQYIYKPNNPLNPMAKDDVLLLQVKEDSNGQKRITIPKDSDLKDKDYVEVKKH